MSQLLLTMNHSRPETEILKQTITDLEKANRVLAKKLDRSEQERRRLEDEREGEKQRFNQALRHLEDSRQLLQKRNSELEETLAQLSAMQAQLVQSEKMSALGMLVAGVAHEIRNPINFVHANIKYASDYVHSLADLIRLYQQVYPEPEPVIAEKAEEIDVDFILEDAARLLESMRVGSDRIREIVTGLRTFSRLDESDYTEADLHEGIESTLMILQHLLKASDRYPEIKLVKNYGKLPLVHCFPGQMNQVFMNILANAIDALRDPPKDPITGLSSPVADPEIQITTLVTPDDWVEIRIANNGIPIDPVVAEKIFQPFFTTKPTGKGTGLGLSISHQIITGNHRGKLMCVSSNVTEFVIMIPRRQKKAVIV